MANANNTHRCDTDNPQRPCCWKARIDEQDAQIAREQTPEWKAAKATHDAERAARHADSFIGRGLD